MTSQQVSRISNSISTGGGGTNFEQNIQSMFLLSLITDGLCPVMNERTKRVCFQAKYLGYSVDDLVVFTERKINEGKLLCQMKHKVIVSQNNKTFCEVINAAWNDFCDEKFDKKRDKIALATAEIAVKSQQALRFLNSQANAASNENDFLHRINLEHFSNEDNKRVFFTIKECIKNAKGDEPNDFELWEFCRVFLLMLFDLDFKESVNRTLASSLIGCKSSYDPILVWSRLVEYASECNQTAASIDFYNIDKSILDYFQGEARIIHAPDIAPETISEIEIDSCQVIESEKDITSLALIGSWREENENDGRIVETISGIKYSDFLEKSRTILSKLPNAVKLKNGCWKVEDKEEVLAKCTLHIFDENIDRLFAAARDVFEQKSKHTQNEQSMYFDSSQEYDNSRELREGILSSICWLKKSEKKLEYCTQAKLDEKIYLFVDNLLNGEWATWVSLRDSLQKLAELSPKAFIKRIEGNIANNPDEIIKLFPKRTDNSFLRPNYLTNLLWAIEIISWIPEYLPQAIGVLGMLESLPYENTNWVNTPINSIVSIMLPWYPQTLANFEKRKNALLCLEKDNKNIFWAVLTKLLPGQTQTTSDNPRPQYYDINIPQQISVTNRELAEQNSYYMELAVDFAENSVERIAFLADMLKFMKENVLEKYVTCVSDICEHITEKERFSIWIKLRDNFESIEPELTKRFSKQSESICSILSMIEPKSIFLKYQELYLGDTWNKKDKDPVKAWEVEEQEKVRAVKEIFDKYGVKETELFGNSVKNTYDVSYKLGISLDSNDISGVIKSYAKKEISKDFAIGCINAFIRTQGVQKLLETSFNESNLETRVEILSGIPYVCGLIDVITKLLPEDSLYWENAIMPYAYTDNNKTELRFLINKLVQNQRYVAAVNLIGRSDYESTFDVEYIKEMLMEAGTKESRGTDSLDEYSIQKVFFWMEKQPNISIKELSDLEFIYLPVLSEYGEKLPVALKARIGTDASYFCEMIELFYKKRSEDKGKKRETAKPLLDRLITVLFNFSVVPGVGRDGIFSAEKFESWFNYVSRWSRENDRYEVTMHTVGSGLSYSHEENSKHPPKVIIEALNIAENEDLRRGYLIGVSNQRGVHIVDPEGKPELELAKDYRERAEQAEKMGYSRYSRLLFDISEQYEREAKYHIEEAK